MWASWVALAPQRRFAWSRSAHVRCTWVVESDSFPFIAGQVSVTKQAQDGTVACDLSVAGAPPAHSWIERTAAHLRLPVMSSAEIAAELVKKMCLGDLRAIMVLEGACTTSPRACKILGLSWPPSPCALN